MWRSNLHLKEMSEILADNIKAEWAAKEKAKD